MKSVMNHPIKVPATGFVVLVFLSLPLFWIRFVCEASIAVGMPEETQDVDRVRPCGIVPAELENDPNVAHHSSVSAGLHDERLFWSLGIVDSLIARYPGGRLSNVYLFGDDEWMYFDKNSGLLVCQNCDILVMPDKSTRSKNVSVYVGPEGISEVPEKTLGRFMQPMIDGSWPVWRGEKLPTLILHDRKLRRFFKIDFSKKTVVKGPELADGSPHEPIQIGQLRKNEFSMHLNWQPPQIKVPDKDPNEYGMREYGMDRRDYEPIIKDFRAPGAGPYLLVLDRTGRIDLLDKETLEFAGAAGWLPAPETYFGTMPSVTPKDLLGYEVWPLVLSKFYLEDGRLLRMTFGQPEPYELELYELEALDIPPGYRPPRQRQVRQVASRVEREYLGMFVASVSRDGTAMVLATFDAQGNRIKTEYTRLPQYEGRRTTYLQSSKAAFWEARWAPTMTIGKYLAENLHPPVLSLASYFIADRIEAGAGHRALFLLPNSFVAMVARDSRGNVAERFFSALWLMLPSIVLSIWLAWRVGRNAAVVGLSRSARRYWIAGTIAFGLAGYITYRLSRPKIALVTCANCGHPRRPDMDKCHRCGSGWHVPELTPPAWRVLDGEE